jgi:hypothetical protein
MIHTPDFSERLVHFARTVFSSPISFLASALAEVDFLGGLLAPLVTARDDTFAGVCSVARFGPTPMAAQEDIGNSAPIPYRNDRGTPWGYHQ